MVLGENHLTLRYTDPDIREPRPTNDLADPPLDHGPKLQDRIPITSSAGRTQLLFNEFGG